MAIKDGLLAEYDHEMGTTRKLLERLPDDKLVVEAARQVDVARRAGHASEQPAELGRDDPERACRSTSPTRRPTSNRKASRADILTALRRELETDARTGWTRPTPSCWRPGPSGAAGRKCSRSRAVAAFRTFVLYHMVHHRGQLSVYLRLNDVPVPAIYGPSADEGVGCACVT